MAVTEADVIIVGAGLSGLAAADHLLTHDESLRVLVLESNDRVGGRTKGHDEDLGGAWIAPNHKNLIQLVDKLGLKTDFPAPSDESNEKTVLKKVIQVGRKGRIRKTTAQPDPVVLPKRPGRHTGIRAWLANLELAYIVWKLDMLFFKIDNNADPYYSSRLDRDLAHVLDSTTVESYLLERTRFKSVRDVMEIQVRFLMGLDLNRISVLYLLAYAKWQGARTFHEFLHNDRHDQEDNMEVLPNMTVRGGAQAISDQLVKQSLKPENLILNQPVQGISFIKESSPGEKIVFVNTKDGNTYKASRVILSVPPCITRSLEFSPTMDHAKRHLLMGMAMGTAIKVILKFDQRYWRQDGFSGDFVSTEGPISWMVDATVTDGLPTLVALLGGRLAVKWASKGKAVMTAAILDLLSTIFESEEWPANYKSIEICAWQDEPDIQGGSLCVPSIGTMHEYSRLRANHGPIYFAGTETATRFTGTMAGAVQAGQRAAVEILDELRPQCLTSSDYHLLKECQTKYYVDEDEALSSMGSTSNRFGFSVFRWTVILPTLALATAYTALRMRDKYGHLVVPKW